MAISGKYNYSGIKKQGAAGLSALLASNPSTAWLIKVPLINTLLEFISNYLANKGLILMNLGAIYVNGVVDQHLLDRAMEEGLKRVEQSGGTLTPEQIKEIDDAVIKAARKALPYVRAK